MQAEKEKESAESNANDKENPETKSIFDEEYEESML